MCKTLGVAVKISAAESLWNNVHVERHNLVLSEVLDKIPEEI